MTRVEVAQVDVYGGRYIDGGHDKSAPTERSFVIQHKRTALFQVRSKAVYVHDDRLCKRFVELEMKQPGYSENAAQEKHHACCKTKQRVFVATIAVDASTYNGENE